MQRREFKTTRRAISTNITPSNDSPPVADRTLQACGVRFAVWRCCANTCETKPGSKAAQDPFRLLHRPYAEPSHPTAFPSEATATGEPIHRAWPPRMGTPQDFEPPSVHQTHGPGAWSKSTADTGRETADAAPSASRSPDSTRACCKERSRHLLWPPAARRPVIATPRGWRSAPQTCRSDRQQPAHWRPTRSSILGRCNMKGTVGRRDTVGRELVPLVRRSGDRWKAIALRWRDACSAAEGNQLGRTRPRTDRNQPLLGSALPAHKLTPAATVTVRCLLALRSAL